MPSLATFIAGFLMSVAMIPPFAGAAETLYLSNDSLEKAIALSRFITVVEDPFDTLSPTKLIQDSHLFKPLADLRLKDPTHTFWLKVELRTANNLTDRHFVINYSNLTFTDLYQFKQGKLLLYHKGGAFRSQAEIAVGDGRFNFNINLVPKGNYILLLKVKHTKRYPPIIDFELQSRYNYLTYHRSIDLTNAWLQGAIAVLSCYAGLSWLINRYRPFLWVFLFILGVGLYSFSLQPAFIDLAFPTMPELGWLLVPLFLHIGIVGFYLLMIDFLDMKKNAPIFYAFGHYIKVGILIFSALAIGHNYLTSNYYLTNQFNLAFSAIHLCYISLMLFMLWRKLDSSQFYLVYGIFVFALAAVAIVVSSLLFSEQSFLYAPLITKTAIMLITILFLTGLNQKLRIHETEKIKALEQLNVLSKQQHTLIERKVEERTLALQKANRTLQLQQEELVTKKNHIETLMDELNHRVKNNLQMLYSLSTLQLPRAQNQKTKDILNEMRGRIRAMILVNEHLNIYREGYSLPYLLLVDEIKQHLQQIYDPAEKVQIRHDIPADISVPPTASLPFGLIVTELITNAFKHAFTSHHPQPIIHLTLLSSLEHIQFIYRDNGKGASHLRLRESMGITLIEDLTRQLKGTVTIQHTSGFNFIFTFPKLSLHAHSNH
ncbi:MAG: histidine kinase dimerization/phosphoacceptor domain -containing protein [Pseudosphingobacterium sp.]|nr:histidine kinase dimerization/phosphoacceptor domain -containing protein [Pseudosphingobacterium sp.]